MTIAYFILPDGSRRSVEAEAGSTLMEIAREANIPGIVAECGGSAICSTCHVHLGPEWLDRIGPPSESESLLLDLAPGRDDTSRLSCQIVVTEALDGVTVRVPEEQAPY